MTRELDSRTNDGIHVRLLWHQAEDRVVVAVDDAKTGDSFVAWHRVPTRPPALAGQT